MGTDADIVVQNIDAAESVHGCLHHGFDLSLVDDIAGAAHGLVAFVGDHAGRFFGGRKIPINQQQPRAFSREQDGGGATVADGFAWRLPGADDDGGLVLQPHQPAPFTLSSSCTPREFSAIANIL